MQSISIEVRNQILKNNLTKALVLSFTDVIQELNSMKIIKYVISYQDTIMLQLKNPISVVIKLQI